MRNSKRHYCTGFLEVVFLCVLRLWDLIRPHRLNVNHRAAVWQDVRPAEEMSVCSVHYSHVGCGTGLAAKWHQTQPLTSFILCRCILCRATFKHSVCVGVFRCEFVCTCMNKYACVWPIVSHSDCPAKLRSFASYDRAKRTAEARLSISESHKPPGPWYDGAAGYIHLGGWTLGYINQECFL